MNPGDIGDLPDHIAEIKKCKNQNKEKIIILQYQFFIVYSTSFINFPSI